MHAQSLSRIRLFATPWTVAHQAPLSMGFSRQGYWSGLPCLPPGDPPDPGIKLGFLASPALAGGFFTTSATWEALGNSGLAQTPHQLRTACGRSGTKWRMSWGLSSEEADSKCRVSRQPWRADGGRCSSLADCCLALNLMVEMNQRLWAHTLPGAALS